MALDREELNKRRKEREIQRKKRLEEQRKLQRKLLLAAVVLVVCIAGIYMLTKDAQPALSTLESVPAETTVPTEAVTEAGRTQQSPATVIHIKAGGDLNITDKVVASANTDFGYDYTNPFLDVAPMLADADLAMLNFEGNVVGEPYGSATVSAPQALVEALGAAGVDVLQMANSYSIYNGMIGLSTTLTNIRAAGIEPVGAFSSPEEFSRSKGYTICDVQGIKVALVAFTKGMGSLGLPAGSEDCVNVLYTDYATTYRDIDRKGITAILDSVAEEEPDITIALLHWGSEYNDTISETQQDIVELMQKEGVDAIIGTHSHMVHELSYDEETGFFVAYSLGDFFGDGSRGGTNYSILLDLEITKDNDTGVTRVTDYGYTPLYTLSESESVDGVRKVVRIRETMAAYDVNFVDRVTKTGYDNMKNALERINDRVTPDPVEED